MNWRGAFVYSFVDRVSRPTSQMIANVPTLFLFNYLSFEGTKRRQINSIEMRKLLFLTLVMLTFTNSLVAQRGITQGGDIPRPVSEEKIVKLYYYDSNQGKMLYSTDAKVVRTKTYVSKDVKIILAPYGTENGYRYVYSYSIVAMRNNEVWVKLNNVARDSDIEGYKFRAEFDIWVYFNY